MTEGFRIGRQIYKLRRICGCTQEEVANALEMSQSYLRTIEHGDANPSVNLVEKIVSFLWVRITGSPLKNGLFDLEAMLAAFPAWRYQIINETLYSDELGWYPTYSIQIDGRQNCDWVCVGLLHDVALDHEFAQMIVERCNRYQPSLTHLRDVIEDMQT